MDNSANGPAEGQILNTSLSDLKGISSFQIEINCYRSCTDVYCLLIFLFLNACQWSLSGWAYSEGDSYRLERGWDTHGNFCGAGAVSGREYAFFPEPMDISVSLCLVGCPGVSAEESLCVYDEEGRSREDVGCFDAYPSKPFFNNYCLPASRGQRVKVAAWLYSSDQVMTRVVGDLSRAWDVPAVAGLIAGAVAVVYLLAFQLRHGRQAALQCLVYALSFPAALFLLAAICFLIYEESGRVAGVLCSDFASISLSNCDEGDTAEGYKYLSGVLIAISVVTAAAIARLCLSFQKGIPVMQAASQMTSPLLWICPIVGLLLIVAFYAYFVTLLIYQVSCGDYDSKEITNIPLGEVRMWSFHSAERVLVFFTVGMALWWLSFIAHFVEFVSAAMAAKWVFFDSEPVSSHFRASVYEAFRFHCGSILLAAIAVPIGRLLRNFLLGLKTLLQLIRLPGAAMRCDSPWMQCATSTAVAIQTILGTPLLEGAKRGYQLLSQKNGVKTRAELYLCDRIIGLTQLVVILIGPDFVAYWIQHETLTFRDLDTRKISSVTAMAIYGLFLSWALAQWYGCVARGLLGGSILSAAVQPTPIGGNSNSQGGSDGHLRVGPVEMAEAQTLIPNKTASVAVGDNVPPPSPKQETMKHFDAPRS